MISPIARWSLGAAVVVGILGVRALIHSVTVQATEIATARSPDGATEAVLLDVPRDAHGAHSARVCLRHSSTLPVPQSLCAEIAYLSGVRAADSQLGIDLEWTGSADLEIRYRQAAAAYLYYSTYAWPSPGRHTYYRYARNLAPIQTRLVHINLAVDKAPAN